MNSNMMTTGTKDNEQYTQAELDEMELIGYLIENSVDNAIYDKENNTIKFY